ncbi:hypothetical protein DUNSADRAFT_9134 [Dunaliella salina]|uniref:Uncharacterized protein n=1 Tax=Dunaliella salina TaxID=3046 RepID=A0ABQ7GI26_DUNSA|nr:hypothetical protein DUNSADRAFT_9134 [Dunaliella salina]|eukprot:KAF5834267.1 hypothetical protein DUNSADRAFT_9134 [Dunaliella salina]
MLAIGMGIAAYMQRKVDARKKHLALKAEEADEEGVELTPMRRPSKDFSIAQSAAEIHQKEPKDMTLTPQLNGTVHMRHDINSLPPTAPATSEQQGPAPLESTSNPLGETGKALALSLSFCCFAGLVAGLLGLGGGMIIGPLLMALKVHPQVSAATSSLMVLFSSSAALISFAVDGRVNGAYAGIFSAAAVIASVAGVLVVNEKVKRSGRTSIVVFMLATIMVLGFCVITAFGVIGMVHDFSTGQNIGTHSLCEQ